MIWIFISFVLFVALIVSWYYLFKFARIILAIEDDLSDAIETLLETETSINNLLTLKMFFDSKEIKTSVDRAMENLKISNIALTKVIQGFTRLSKQKYIMVRVNEDEEKDQES